jgi:retron-type reverse transcriptase
MRVSDLNILEKLSSALAINKIDLYKYIKTSPHRYKTYTIPKRNGKGVRWIAQPSKNLKYLQRTVLDEFLLELPVHSSAVAYTKGVGIKENAKRHKNNQYILKMDFKDFFPSIKPDTLLAHIKNHLNESLTREDMDIIKSIFFWSKNKSKNYQLSIGAPSSPFISNTIMYNFDLEVADLVDSNITYTRYADDLVFSTNKQNILYSVPKIIEIIIAVEFYSFLKINSSKTMFLSKKCKRIVTGLIIDNNNNTSIGRNKKRYIKSLVHQFSHGNLSPEDIYMLQGYMAFIHDVEPVFCIRLRKKYGDKTIDSIVYYNK